MAEIDLQPTEAMASNAARGLELRKKHGKGGTAIGVARARDISNRKHLSPETVRRMHAFFNRHEKNKSGGEDDAGYIAWLLWGGDSGKTWAASKFKQLDKDKNAKGNPRMERSDQLAEMLMKPVTLTNHKQMEKVVDAAIAHAKRVGDADLLELAEETGHEILALRSRAARPGAKAKMAADTSREAAQRVSAELKALMPIAKKIQTTREVLRETEKQGKWRDCIGTAQSLSIQYSQLANQYMRVAAAIENERAALGFSRPGAKAKMAMSANEKAMLVARWHAVTKLLEEARSRLFAAERAQDEVERLKAIKDIQQYSAQRNAATAALKREGMMSRPGAKAVFVRLPDDYARNFQYMKELMGDITRAFKDTDHISLKEAAHDFLGFAKKIREEAFSDAADMKKHPQDWNARPGAKVANALSDACWEGYEAVGTKQKDGKTVPNCVPMAKQEESEEVRSGLKMIAAKDQAVADKIRTLIGEGKDQKQAVAIALDLKRRGEI